MKNSKIYPWVVVGLLWVVALLNYMDRQMLSTMQSAMQVDIAELGKAENFGRLMGIFLLIYGFLSPFAGAIADRINRKWLLVGSLFVWSAVTYGMGYATTFNQLYWLRAFMGISEALYMPAALALISDYHSNKTRSLAIGIHMTGLYTGQALGGFGAVIASNFSWQSTFHVFGIIGIVYSLILVVFLHEKADRPGKQMVPESVNQPKQRKESVWKSFGLLFSTFSFWILLFYFLAPSLPGWATKNWLPTLFTENLGIPMNQAGPIATISISFASLIGILIGGPLSDRWVMKNIRGRMYTSAIGMGLMIPSLLLLGFGHTYAGLISAALLFGIGYGMADTNNMPILCQIIPAKYRGTAYGMMNMVGVFGGYFITLLLGSSTDQGNLGSDFSKLGLVVLVAVVLMIVFLKPKKEYTYTSDEQANIQTEKK
ncbi:MAG: MFS transporter [Dysgonamonadaceae bacterium]|jgi:MFS family permease|nr:MFS transporter [Dysgonamonadaceae bacterium]MDD4399202.1 MFS transporter [Dysgonamonadaceae bacterium]MEA5081989.1 MFS transporter [Dysgonamonadaceae bacterium]